MEQTLVNGDRVIINKLAYGARIPITPLSLSFLRRSLYIDRVQLPYFRLPGYSAVKRNDIVVFNFPLETELPVDERKEYIKRCIGIPNDTLTIKDGAIYINSMALEEKKSILLSFTRDSKQCFLPKYIADSLLLNGVVISRKTIDTTNYNPAVFPNNSSIRWNTDNFGPIYIPKKGSSVTLNKKNSFLYQRIIEEYEHNTLKLINDSIYINDQPVHTYTFKMNYYFVIGDNRYNSNDSRFWGFVPEDHLIGNVSFLLYSTNKNPGRATNFFTFLN